MNSINDIIRSHISIESRADIVVQIEHMNTAALGPSELVLRRSKRLRDRDKIISTVSKDPSRAEVHPSKVDRTSEIYGHHSSNATNIPKNQSEYYFAICESVNGILFVI